MYVIYQDGVGAIDEALSRKEARNKFDKLVAVWQTAHRTFQHPYWIESKQG